jgi:hypothetical protein
MGEGWNEQNKVKRRGVGYTTSKKFEFCVVVYRFCFDFRFKTFCAKERKGAKRTVNDELEFLLSFNMKSFQSWKHATHNLVFKSNHFNI